MVKIPPDTTYTPEQFRQACRKVEGLSGEAVDKAYTHLSTSRSLEIKRLALKELVKKEVSVSDKDGETLLVWRNARGKSFGVTLGSAELADQLAGDEGDPPSASDAGKPVKEPAAKDAAARTERDGVAQDAPSTRDTQVEEPSSQANNHAAAALDETEPSGDVKADDTATPDPQSLDGKPQTTLEQPQPDSEGRSGGGFFTRLASILEGGSCQIVSAGDLSELTVTFLPVQKDKETALQSFSVSASPAELDHPEEGFSSLLQTQVTRRQTLKEAEAELEAATKEEAEEKKAQAAKKRKDTARSKAKRVKGAQQPEKAKPAEPSDMFS